MLAVTGGRPSRAAAYVQVFLGGSTTPTVFPAFSTGVSEPVVTDDYKGVGPFILAALELGR